MSKPNRSQPRGSLLLAAILATGFAAVWLVVIFIVLGAGLRIDLPDPGHPAAFTWLIAMVLLSPAFSATTLLFLTPIAMRYDAQSSGFDAVKAVALYSAAPLCATCLISALLAAWVYYKQRMLSERNVAAWTAFVFLMGLPGLVGYLLHCRWPAAEHCQHCGKTSPRDRDACLHCGTAFPPPAPKGIEIFA